MQDSHCWTVSCVIYFFFSLLTHVGMPEYAYFWPF